MSNTRTARPTTARKATRKSEQKRKSGLQDGLRIELASGEVYEARYGDVTPQIARELRRNLGIGFQGLMQALGTDPDVDLLSAFVWVARRCQGEAVAFDSVWITYEDLDADGFDINRTQDDAEDADEDADPEA